jgi:Carboxypeptidase regulatory-like domain/TonB dependent receptor
MLAPSMTTSPTRLSALVRGALAAGLVVCATLVSAGIAAAAPPQSATASARFVVDDSTSAVVLGATIVLTSLDSGATRKAQSRSDGSIEFVALPPGRYRVTVELDGFVPIERRFELTIDEQRELHVTLAVGRFSSAAAVNATNRPLVEPAKTSLGRTISTREIDQLPIATALFRDVTNLATLAPGVVSDVTGVSGIATAGQSGNDNTFLLDGLSVDSAISGGQVANLPADAVREVRVVSNHFDVEFGQASGAVVNMVTRSGTNTPTGRAYYFQQSGAWNASPPQVAAVSTKQSGLSQELVGGFWGGPLARERAFLFGSVEQVVQHSQNVNPSPVALEFRPLDPLVWPVETHAPKGTARADINVRSSNLLTVRAIASSVTSDDSSREPQSALERGRTQDTIVRSVAVLDSQVMGSSAVNEARAQWVRTGNEFGVGGFCSDCAALNYPDIKLGKPSNAPQDVTGQRGEVADVLTKTANRWGRHTLKVGVDVMAVQQFGTNPTNASGTYTFPQGAGPFNPLDKSTYPRMFTQNLGDASFHVRETIVSTFGQDEWQPLDGLSANLGVRWDRTAWPLSATPENDLALRAGLSFDPWKRSVTVFRVAAGRYYDETLLPVARDAEVGFVQITIQNPGYQGDPKDFDPYGPNPRRSGQAIQQVSVNRTQPTSNPYTDQFSVGLQRQFGSNVGVTADLVRALGYHLLVGGDLNYPDPITNIRPDPTIKQILVAESRGQSWYTGLQVGVYKRLSHGYAYSVAYTLSSSQNDTDGRSALPQDQNNILADRGPSLNDARHRVTANGTVSLPWNLHLAAVVSARSALPYNIVTTTDANGDGQNDRPPGVGRDSARGSAFFQADVRISKAWMMGRPRLELMAEAFNVTNRSNWTTYNGMLGALTFGQATGAGPPRQLQFGLRFDF